MFIFKDAKIFIVLLFAVSFIINIYLIIPKIRGVFFKPMPIDTLSVIEKLIEEQRPTFYMLNEKPSIYVGESLFVYGYASFSDNYDEGLSRESREEYYLVLLWNNNIERIQVYFKKKDNRELYEILSREDDIPMKMKVREPEYNPTYWEKYGRNYATVGYTWEVLDSNSSR